MKFDFTKGDWKVGARTNFYKLASKNKTEMKKLEELGKAEFEALSVGIADKGQIAIIPLDESNEANARLIAKAPEMVKALARDIIVYDSILEVFGEAKSIEGVRKHHIEIIEEALGKKWKEIIKDGLI